MPELDGRQGISLFLHGDQGVDDVAGGRRVHVEAEHAQDLARRMVVTGRDCRGREKHGEHRKGGPPEKRHIRHRMPPATDRPSAGSK